MKKIILILAGVLIIILNSAFSFWEKKERSPYIQQPDAIFTVEEITNNDSFFIPGYGRTFLGFKEAIAFKESQGRYHIVNTLGYMGKYQFGESTLNTLRIYNFEYFLYNSQLQEKAFWANCSYNKWLLHDEITKHAGTTIKGINITESGIIAAAHLAGAGSVKRFLRKKGRNKRIVDAFGTSIEQYLIKFADYDISFIEASKRPSLKTI